MTMQTTPLVFQAANAAPRQNTPDRQAEANRETGAFGATLNREMAARQAPPQPQPQPAARPAQPAQPQPTSAQAKPAQQPATPHADKTASRDPVREGGTRATAKPPEHDGAASTTQAPATAGADPQDQAAQVAAAEAAEAAEAAKAAEAAIAPVNDMLAFMASLSQPTSNAANALGTGAQVAGATVAGAPLTQATGAAAPVASAALEKASLASVSLAAAPFAGAPLAGAPLAGAALAGAPLTGGPLVGAPLAGVSVAGATGAGAASAGATSLADAPLMAAGTTLESMKAITTVGSTAATIATTSTGAADKSATDAIGNVSAALVGVEQAPTNLRATQAAAPAQQQGHQDAGQVQVQAQLHDTLQQKVLAADPAPAALAALQAPLARVDTLANPVALQGDRIAARLGTPAWDNQVSQRIVYMVGKEQAATLTLNPPDLGPVQIVLNVSNDQATVAFSSDQLEVRQALENALPRLREMMNESGIALGNATVDAGAPNGRGQQDSERRAQAGQGGPGDATGDEQEAAPALNEVAPRTRTVAIGERGMVDLFA